MAVMQPSFTNKGLLKAFDLLVSNTSKTLPLVDLRQAADFTKFERLYVSVRSENRPFPSHFGSSILTFRPPAII